MINKNVTKKIFTNKLGNNSLLILVYTIVYIYFIGMPKKLVNDLDPSWQFTINYAVSNNLIFGKDIIFTYGPLGYLFYSTMEGLNHYHMFIKYLFQFSYLIVFMFMINDLNVIIDKININKFLKNITKYLLIPFAFLKSTLFSDFSPIIFLTLLYAYNQIINNRIHFIKKSNIFLLFFLTITSNILFFGKVSYGIFVLFYALLYIFHLLINKEFRQLIAFSTIIIFIFIFTLKTTSIDLEYYLKNSYEIIIGYKNSMMIDLVTISKSTYIKYYIFYFLFLTIALYFFISLAKNIIKNKYKLNILLIINSASLYYIFSYSFSRGIGSLIFATPLVIFIFYNFVESFYESDIKKLFFYITFIILSVHLTTFLYLNLRRLNVSNSKPDLLNEIIFNKKNRINFNKKETFDIYPYLTSIAYFNNLNYKPRPIIQSYSCYTYKLDSINSVFFQNKHVDYIIFHNSPTNLTWGGPKLLGNSIDNRYFMFEEPITKIQILNNYENPINVGDSLFFVEKNSNANFLKFNVLKSNIIKFEDTIVTQEQELLFATFDFKIKNETKVLSLIHNLPNVFIEFELNNGKKISHQVVVNLLKSPVLINYYCIDYHDFFNIKKNPTSINKVKKIKFFQSYNGYKDEINVNFYKAKINNQ